VQPLLDVVLIFLGIPLVLTRENRNVFVAAGQCLGLTLGFFVITLASQSLGSSYLINPVLAAWIPLLVFAPLAYVFARPLWD
jgi:lipopolysaccharide export system permease protein